MTEALTLSIMSTSASPCHRQRLHLKYPRYCLLRPEKRHLNAFVTVIIFILPRLLTYDVDLTVFN